MPTDIRTFLSQSQPIEEWEERLDSTEGGFWVESIRRMRSDGSWNAADVPLIVNGLRFPMPIEAFRAGSLARSSRQLDDDDFRADDAIACSVADDELDQDAATMKAVLRSMTMHGKAVAPIQSCSATDVEWDPDFVHHIGDVHEVANLILQTLTSDELGGFVQDLRHPNRWMTERPLQWSVIDPTGRPVPVDDLGAGGRRWAKLAMSLALQSTGFLKPQVLIVDEPERALHSSAQLEIAKGFARVAEEEVIGDLPFSSVMVASHSPAFLALAGARLVHVSRNSIGTVELDMIDTTIDPGALALQLGLSRPDALLTVRTFVFVEGEHDRAVLKTLFSETLAARHAVLGVMRGAANLEAHLTADHILAYSDARIRVIIDSVGVAITQSWSRAVAAFAAGDRTLARRELDQIVETKGKEAKWLSEAGRAALARGQLDRIEVIGLERPDIIHYLPVERFVPDAGSWHELVTEWRQPVGRRPTFKEWLVQAKGAVVNSQVIADAAIGITDHADLHRVVEGL